MLFLPPYAPELNPTERFFGELRKATANLIFKTIAEQEVVIEERLRTLSSDLKGMKNLLGYEWILDQCLGLVWDGIYNYVLIMDVTAGSMYVRFYDTISLI